jgi:hypothetical protein
MENGKLNAKKKKKIKKEEMDGNPVRGLGCCWLTSNLFIFYVLGQASSVYYAWRWRHFV